MSIQIRVAGVRKSYLGAPALDGVTADAASGQLTLIAGPSGSGKTTLLNMISALDVPDAGTVNVDGAEVTAFTSRERDRYRAGNGHVFQRSGLLGGLTVAENIASGHALTGRPVDPTWVRHLLQRLEISELLDARATLLSGGQAQRVALVRALAHRPAHLFADEPTASLDIASKHVIHTLLRQVAEQEGTTVLVVSHDEISSSYAHQSIHLLDGRITSADRRPHD